VHVVSKFTYATFVAVVGIKCDGSIILCCLVTSRGTRWRSWLRHRATSRKVAGSIPDAVIGIFH